MENCGFEREVVAVLTEIIESRGLKHKPIAEQAWPWKKDPVRTWQDMRNGKTPQKLTIREAHGMAQVLGLSMSALCGIVEGRAIQEAMRHQECASEKKEVPAHITSGRPAPALEADPANIN